MYDELWSAIEIVDDSECCNYCGQPRLIASNICEMCQVNQDGVVFGIVRELLIVAGNKIKESLKKSKKGENSDKVCEIAIAKVLEDFPKELAKRTERFNRALETEGIWFSHLVAYWMIRYLRGDKKWPITRMVMDEMYFYTRDQVFVFLKEGEKGFSDERIETILSFYHIPDAEKDARKIIFNMMLELERQGRIKIMRPKAKCLRCDKEISGPSPLCPECQKDDSLDTRMSIATGMMEPPSLLSEEPEKPNRLDGMHYRKE